MINKIIMACLLILNSACNASDLAKPTIYALCDKNEHVFHARCAVRFYGFFGHLIDQQLLNLGNNCSHDPQKIVIGYQRPLKEITYCAICKKQIYFKD